MANINLLKEVEVWFTERPKWIQDAIRRLILNGMISETDLNELIVLCKSEAGILETELKPIGISKGCLSSKEENINLRLNAIKNIKGINALSPRKPLQFGNSPLTVIYGQNGSGKSGYVRILKHACSAKKTGKLLGNVFDNSCINQGCSFDITMDLITKELEWTPNDGVLNELHSVELYDSDCANIYVNEENELSYEPWILSLFSKLTEVCDKVGQVLKSEMDQVISKKPKLPDEFGLTNVAAWYNQLSYKTKEQDINEKCLFTKEMEDELVQIRQRLTELNPAEKVQALRKTKLNVESLKSILNAIRETLTIEKCKIYIECKKDAILKRKVADEDAKKVFEGSSLEGVGTESWKLLWERAREYSEKMAYPGMPFPNISDQSKCVLCHQELTEEGKTRLTSFEEFVKGELEKQAKDAEKRLTELNESFGNIPTFEQINLYLDSAGITNDTERIKIIDFCKRLEDRKNSILMSSNIDEVKFSPDEEPINYLAEYISSIEQQAAAFDEIIKEDNRELLDKKRSELEATKWIAQQKESIEKEVERLKLIKKLKEAQSSANTHSISLKKSSLADELITSEYIKRFDKELKALGASRIKVEMVKTKAQKGHIYHQIKLKGSNTSEKMADVLSEGEFRIVSLAGFLADAKSREINTPFIFDDPISSLDQDFEELTVKRLIKLCVTRQVIIFTHRLSMVTLIEEEAEKNEIICNVVCLRNEKWGVGEPGDTPIFVKKPEKALNKLLNERLVKAKKILEENGKEEYELLAKGICSDFRILLERFIENDLLADVIQRFRRAVNTVGKIHKLASIKKEDCQLFDDLMTKYSKYEHSQSNELPVELPLPDELKEDMEKVKGWQDEFKKRQAS